MFSGSVRFLFQAGLSKNPSIILRVQDPLLPLSSRRPHSMYPFQPAESLFVSLEGPLSLPGLPMKRQLHILFGFP